MTVRLDDPIKQHVVHIAIYRWRDDASVPDLEAAMEKLRGMADDIPEIRLITWGRNTNRWAEGFTHAILVIAENEAAIAQYRSHPLHREVAEYIDACEDYGIGVDFKRPDSFDYQRS